MLHEQEVNKEGQVQIYSCITLIAQMFLVPHQKGYRLCWSIQIVEWTNESGHLTARQEVCLECCGVSRREPALLVQKAARSVMINSAVVTSEWSPSIRSRRSHSDQETRGQT